MSSRKLALSLAYVAITMLVAMIAVSAATGATQEAHEYAMRPVDYAAALLAHPGATRLVFAIDLVFLVAYMLMFVALADHLLRRGAPRYLVYVAGSALLLTGVLDIVEDHHILSLLSLTETGGVPSDGMLTTQQTLSACKFTISTLGLVAFGLAIPRDRIVAWALSAFLVVATVATTAIDTAAPADAHAALDAGRWVGFLAGFIVLAIWLRTERDP